MSAWVRVPSQRSCLALALAVILVLGLTLGLSLHANAHIPQPWNQLSNILGWLYFWCWTFGFYPQVFINYQRKSVVGLSLDFAVFNWLGFLCYAIFNCAFYYSDSVQQQYMRRYDGSRNAVEANDVFFSLHAAVLVGVTLLQCLLYRRDGHGASKATVAVFASTVVGGLSLAAIVAATGDREDSPVNTLNVLYLLSYMKLLMTLVKYVPQVYMNYTRKSTVGWSIWNVLLDIPGGLLSIAQLVLDAWATDDWQAISGDPVKLLLGVVSIFFDVIFMLQHYVWYDVNNRVYYTESGTELKSLLP